MGHPADRATDALVFNIAAQQQRNGRWYGGGIPRPPIEDGDFTRTALGIRALKAYGPPGRMVEMNDRAHRAAEWLRKTRPITAEDRAFRLLGLTWGGADASVRRDAVKDILALQRPDGGWNQRDELSTDAYATGLTIYALKESGSEVPAATVERASQLPPLVAARRRIVVRAKPVGEVPAVLRWRLPVRTRSVDFVDGDGVGDGGAGLERELMPDLSGPAYVRTVGRTSQVRPAAGPERPGLQTHGATRLSGRPSPSRLRRL
jgi:hypothetical protein